MSRSLTIGLDLDGVIYDFVADARQAVQRFIDRPGVLEAVNAHPEATKWDFFTDWGISKDEFWTVINQGIDAGIVWHHGQPFPEAIRAVKELRSRGHSLHVVTARPAAAQTATALWLDTHGVEYTSLTFAHDKTVVPCDVFLEDFDENLCALDSAGINAVRFERPYNGVTFHGRSVPNWSAFLTHVTELSNDEQRPVTPLRTITNPYTGEVREVDPSTGGAKGTKPAQASLIPPVMLGVLAEIYGNGAKKYERENWRQGHRWSLSYDAAMRHLAAFWSGEDLDPVGLGGDGLPHLMHAAFSLFTLATFADEGLGTDDRPYAMDRPYTGRYGPNRHRFRGCETDANEADEPDQAVS